MKHVTHIQMIALSISVSDSLNKAMEEEEEAAYVLHLNSNNRNRIFLWHFGAEAINKVERISFW